MIELLTSRENSQNSRENTCARVSFLIKLPADATTLLKKETLTQVFPREFWEIFKNTLFMEHLRATGEYLLYVKFPTHADRFPSSDRPLL